MKTILSATRELPDYSQSIVINYTSNIKFKNSVDKFLIDTVLSIISGITDKSNDITSDLSMYDIPSVIQTEGYNDNLKSQYSVTGDTVDNQIVTLEKLVISANFTFDTEEYRNLYSNNKLNFNNEEIYFNYLPPKNITISFNELSLSNNFVEELNNYLGQALLSATGISVNDYVSVFNLYNLLTNVTINII